MKKCILALVILMASTTFAFAKRTRFFHMGRNFLLVTPDRQSPSALPLLVLLHGCKQNPSLIVDGTEIEKEVIKHNFIVLAPEQQVYSNIDHCWNWFLGFQQERSMVNEMGQIISAISSLSEDLRINQNKIFVAGISAGGVMAHSLMTCYPEVFSGAAIHSGLNYKAAESISEAQTVLTSYKQKSPEYLGKKMYDCARPVRGDKHKLKRVIVIHGKRDSRVPSLHSELISRSQKVWRDYIDDGLRNRSVSGRQRPSVQRYPRGYSVEVSETRYSDFIERVLLIENLGHAWGGGKPLSVNFDPEAPSSNDFILDFFSLKK